MNYIWTQISYSSQEAHLKNQRVACVKKEKNAVKLQKRKAAYSEHSIGINSISKADYVTAALAIVRAKLRTPEASSFCDF